MNKKIKMEPKDELTQDFLQIINIFCCRNERFKKKK